MKKIFILFSLFLLPFAFVYPQTEAKSDCEKNLEDIFKVLELKIKFEIVEDLYKESWQRESFLFSTFNHYLLNRYFMLIRGSSYFENPIDSMPHIKPEETEYMSKEEIDNYLERLNYTPGEAYKDYTDFIRNIKREKEFYLKSIDVELTKYFDSEYAKHILRYVRTSPSPSLSPPWITKLDYLNVFKEFIFNNDEVSLPNFFRVKVYLDCGCKTPYFRESTLRYYTK